MVRKVDLPELRRIRHEVVGIIHDLGVDLEADKEGDVMLVVGEALTNIVEHGECHEIDLGVAALTDRVIVTIGAPCYRDPQETRRWFKNGCLDADDKNERGRGSRNMKALSKVRIHKGSIDLEFKLPMIRPTTEPQMATA